eukprot:5342687-Pyramimonas_sp.AAC.1
MCPLHVSPPRALESRALDTRSAKLSRARGGAELRAWPRAQRPPRRCKVPRPGIEPGTFRSSV